jgi:hypothetical protein
MPTYAAVGITSCWVMLVSVPEKAGAEALAWVDRMGRRAQDTGAKARRVRSEALLLHWRDEQMAAADVRAFVRAAARQPRPPGAQVAVHHGAVRVGPGPVPSEETLVGATVSLAHGLESVARKLGVPVLLSEAAVRTLGLGPEAAPLGPHPVPGAPGAHELFSLGGA